MAEGDGANAANASKIIEKLALVPHPEGGWFKQTFRDRNGRGGRALSTAIYYLLEREQVSAWHRVDAAEIWHNYAGAPLRLEMAETETSDITALTLGADVLSGQAPQIVVPATHWQSARSLGAFTLVGCTVAPGFEFGGFEMASAGWRPGL